MTYKLDYKNLFDIVDLAKGKMMGLSLPVYISEQEVGHGQIPSLAILEATLMFLNAKGLLAQQIEIDYTMDYMDNDSEELKEREPVK